MADRLWGRVRGCQFRGKRRLLDAVGPRAGLRTAAIFGAQFVLDLSDPVQRRMFLGTHEAIECRTVGALLRPGMTVVDGGANAGLYTALAAACVGASGRVIAYEPQPHTCARLREMVARNRLPGVEVVEAALTGDDGRQKLVGDTLADSSDPAGVWVATRRLDDEARRLGLDFIDLLKLDVEGYEPHALIGAHALLAAGRIGALLCEFREPELRAAGSSCAALGAMVEQAGLVPDPRLAAGGDNRLFRLNSGQQL